METAIVEQSAFNECKRLLTILHRKHIRIDVMTRNRASWRGLYFRQSLSLLMFLAFPFALASAARTGTTVFRIIGGLYVALFLYCGYLLDSWRCPQCGMRFLRKGESGVVMPFRNRCANCQLRLGSEVEDRHLAR